MERQLNIPDYFSRSGLQGYKIFLDRYTLKAPKGELEVDDLVLVITKKDPKFPQKEIGFVKEVAAQGAIITLLWGEEFYQDFDLISKPLELTPDDVTERVANALVAKENKYSQKDIAKQYKKILFDYFLPGGRILAGAGVEGLTMSNCFILPDPEDSRMGVFERAKEMTECHSRGGGVGINLSSLRPRYTYVAGVNGQSSGAVSWGEIFNLSTGLVEQGGSRRGATMVMIHDWHPDIFEFIEAKRHAGRYENTNMSICISDGFMDAVERDDFWNLIFPDTTHPDYNDIWDGNITKWQSLDLPVKIYKTIKARDIWSLLIESAWASAEPGLHFLERSNKMSNSWYLPGGELMATNPCAEQPLEPYGVCNLGAIDLSRMIEDGEVNWDLLKEVIHTSVRLLDAVIDNNTYPLEKIAETHRANRRIGLGTMGLGEMLIRLKIRYGSEESLVFIDALYKFMARESYLASINLAKIRGPFKGFDPELHVRSGFMQGMPQDIKDQIKEHGIRNVCIITQAPTGTTGTMAGTSTGIEPYFSWQYTRTSRLGVHLETVPVLKDLGIDIGDLPEYCVTAQELKPEDHVKVQAAVQRWTDSAISKTANAPSSYSLEDTDKLYRQAFQEGCKGVTIYRDQSRSEQVLSVVPHEEKVSEVVVEENQGGCSIVYLDDGSVYSKCD